MFAYFRFYYLSYQVNIGIKKRYLSLPICWGSMIPTPVDFYYVLSFDHPVLNSKRNLVTQYWYLFRISVEFKMYISLMNNIYYLVTVEPDILSGKFWKWTCWKQDEWASLKDGRDFD